MELSTRFRLLTHFKVSGGGGWGAKIGLLSLDPETTLIEEVTTSGGAHDENSYMHEHAMRDIVCPGDFIQFYIVADPNSDLRASITKEESSGFRDVPRLVLGAIPSSIDDMPLIAGNAEQVELTESNVVVQKMAFGALSESGIYLSAIENSEEGLKTFITTRATKTSTKLDMPHTTFIYSQPTIIYGKKAAIRDDKVVKTATVETGKESSEEIDAIPS